MLPIKGYVRKFSSFSKQEEKFPKTRAILMKVKPSVLAKSENPVEGNPVRREMLRGEDFTKPWIFQNAYTKFKTQFITGLKFITAS